MAQDKVAWVVDLEDGRQIPVPAEIGNEQAAKRYAEQWARLNPAGEMGVYEVELEDGRKIQVPATSEQGAQAFVTQVYTPTGRAQSDAFERQSQRDAQAGSSRFIDNAASSMVLGADNITNAAIAAGITGVQNLVGDGPGYGMGDSFNAQRTAQNAARRDFESEEGLQSLGSTLLGGIATPGALQAGGAIAGAGRGGLLSANLLPAAGRSAAVGTGYSATTGLLNSDPGEELQDTARGAVTGFATGAAIPLASAAASGAARTVVGGGRSMLNAATGGRIPALAGNVDRQALSRLGDAMRADGVEEAQIRNTMNDAMRYGLTPNLVDLLPRSATRTRNLIMGAAQRPGEAMGVAQQYRDDVAAAIPGEASEMAYRLTPGETRSAAAYTDDLASANRQIAEETYREPYAARVTLDAEAQRALQDMGPQLNAARQESSFRFPEQADDIAALQNGGAEVSAAALDRVNRQIGTTARNLTRSLENPNPGLAADYTARGAAIDGILDDVPGLLPARSAYRGYANAENATELGADAFKPATRPADYAHELDVLEQIEARSEMGAGFPLPGARQSAGVGARDQIVQNMGRAKDGATGALNDFASPSPANNNHQVLEATYGPEATETFQGGIGMLRDRMRFANTMDSTVGARTAGALQADDFANGPRSVTGVALALIGKIRRGATLTDADRAAIVRLSTQFGNVPQTNLAPRGVPVSGRAVIPALALGRE